MLYTFIHKITGETKEINMPMSEYTHYKGENGEDENWERVYEAPQVNMGNYIGKKINPWSRNQFVEKTGKMKGTYGDLENYSAEMSERRAAESATGEDPIKRKHFDKYEKTTGKKHPKDKPKVIETKNIKLEL